MSVRRLRFHKWALATFTGGTYSDPKNMKIVSTSTSASASGDSSSDSTATNGTGTGTNGTGTGTASSSRGRPDGHFLNEHLLHGMARLDVRYLDLLKVDVEGSEWEVFAELFQTLRMRGEVLPVGQLVIELHYRR